MPVTDGNPAIVRAAIQALTAPWSEDEARYCLRFARTAVERAGYGDRFDALFRPDRDPAAKEAARAFRAAGWAVSGKPKPGDLLFKTDGDYGHVGILIEYNAATGRGKVAENSTAHVGAGDRDARGTRTLGQFGPWQVTVRLPVLSMPAKRIVELPTGRRIPYDLAKGQAVAPVRAVAEACGATVTAQANGIIVIAVAG